eukprot:scaffold14136_cov124-Skeletonema_marinoi.AAC.2
MTIIKSSSSPTPAISTDCTIQQQPTSMTIEAELSKTLNISWTDARDLASYARGKLDIIPGDTKAEQKRRNCIIRSAIEADKQVPRKRVQKRRKIPSKEEQNIQKFKNPEHNCLIRWGFDRLPRRGYYYYNPM